jgi:hypothetical protein
MGKIAANCAWGCVGDAEQPWSHRFTSPMIVSRLPSVATRSGTYSPVPISGSAWRLEKDGPRIGPVAADVDAESALRALDGAADLRVGLRF